MTLADVSSGSVYIRKEKTVEVVNYLKEQAESGFSILGKCGQFAERNRAGGHPAGRRSRHAVVSSTTTARRRRKA